MHKADKKGNVINPTSIIALIILSAVVWCFYSGLFVYGNLQTGSKANNYFKNLAVSFKHGRLDIDRSKLETIQDLVIYNGKYYLCWPPVPAIVYMAFTTDSKDTPDNLIAASFGTLNAILITVFLFLFSKRYMLKFRQAEILFLAVFWTFGTVHFYMSMIGSVWFIAQIMAQTFLLVSILFMLSGTSPASLLLSSLFYSAAVYTRNDLVFSAFFLAAIYMKNRGKKWKKYAVKDTLMFALPFICFSALNMAYNAARFDGRIFDNGLDYHNMDPYLRQNFDEHGYMSVFYIPYNFYTEIIKPIPVISKFPFFLFSDKGFGFLWASPLFFLVIPAAYYFWAGAKCILTKKAKVKGPLNRDDITIMTGAAISWAGTAITIFMIMNNGWAQFASRYSLDFQLMVLVFILFLLKIWRNWYFYSAALVLLFISIYIQYYGVKYFV